MTENKTEQEPRCVRKRKCLTEMRDQIRLIGTFSVNKTQLSNKYGFEWHTVNRWFTNILKETPPENLNNIKVMGESGLRKSLAQLEKTIVNPNSTDNLKLNAIKAFNETIKSYTEFLEQYNMKDKVIEGLKVEVGGNLDIERIVKIAQEAKERKK